MRTLAVVIAGVVTTLMACAKSGCDGTALIQPAQDTAATGGATEVVTSRGAALPPAAMLSVQQHDAGTATKVTGFRIFNRSKRVAYVDAKWGAVHCQTAAGEHCGFWRGYCFNPCSGYSKGADCCIQCEPPLPGMLAIPSGESRVVRWNAELERKVPSHCSGDCQCQEVIGVPNGTYSASVDTYFSYVCDPLPCEQSAGGALANASPQGRAVKYGTRFSIPFVGEEIPIEIRDP